LYASDIQRARNDIAAIRSYQEKLASDSAASPGYISPNAPASTDITAAIQAGKAAIAAEHRRVHAAEAQAARLVAQARAIAAQAHSAGCG
jgi:hypothetical protein